MVNEWWVPFLSGLEPDRAEVVRQVLENTYKYVSFTGTDDALQLQLPHQKWAFAIIRSIVSSLAAWGTEGVSVRAMTGPVCLTGPPDDPQSLSVVARSGFLDDCGPGVELREGRYVLDYECCEPPVDHHPLRMGLAAEGDAFTQVANRARLAIDAWIERVRQETPGKFLELFLYVLFFIPTHRPGETRTRASLVLRSGLISL